MVNAIMNVSIILFARALGRTQSFFLGRSSKRLKNTELQMDGRCAKVHAFNPPNNPVKPMLIIPILQREKLRFLKGTIQAALSIG